MEFPCLGPGGSIWSSWRVHLHFGLNGSFPTKRQHKLSKRIHKSLEKANDATIREISDHGNTIVDEIGELQNNLFGAIKTRRDL